MPHFLLLITSLSLLLKLLHCIGVYQQQLWYQYRTIMADVTYQCCTEGEPKFTQTDTRYQQLDNTKANFI